MRPYVVIFVHGTFARSAEWTQANSAVRRIFEAELDAAVLFRTFEWSGANSHTERLAAAEELRIQLDRSLRDHPQHRHLIVAHSHGGNIAAYALRDATLRSNVIGLITMGTPFIACKPRHLLTTIKFFQYAIPTLLCLQAMILWCFFSVWLIHSSDAFGVDSTVVFVLVLTVCPVIFLFLIVIPLWKFLRRLIQGRFYRWLLREQDAILNRIRLPDISGLRVLCGVIAGDEAAVLLATAANAGNLLHWIFSRLLLVLKLVAWVLLVVFVLNLPLDAVSHRHSQIAESVAAEAMMALVLISIAGIAVYIINIVISPLTRSHPAAFGWEPLTYNVLADIRTTEFPAYVSPHTFEIVRIDISQSRFRLRHSAIYNDPWFIVHAARWASGVPCGDRIFPDTPRVMKVARSEVMCWLAFVLALIMFRISTYLLNAD